MKRALLIVTTVLMISSVARADLIGIYADFTGSTCQLAAGFSPSVAIIHKLSLGTTGSRFKVIFPPGSNFFSFPTAFTATGTLTSDITVDYGSCLTGSVTIGNIVAVLAPGTLAIAPADGAEGYVIRYNCAHEQKFSYAENACVGGPGDCCYMPLATEAMTWGKVKALYQ